jgi:hypothetical protein
MTKVRVVKTPPGTGYIPIGKEGTFSLGAIVDVSEVDAAEVKHLLDEKYVEIVPETSAPPQGSVRHSGA